MRPLPAWISKLPAVLPVLGGGGFVALSEVSIRRPYDFLWWSVVTAAWILAIFFALVRGKLGSRLTPLAVPAVLMIVVSSVASLLFLNLINNRHVFISVFGFVLYLFLEHVRREDAAPDPAERLLISEFARMVNIGSMFLVASILVGTPAFLSIDALWTVPVMAAIAALWSWHLYAACLSQCPQPRVRMFFASLAVLETFLVALKLPTSMFVGGSVVGIVYYVAANLLPLGASEAIPARLVRKYALYAGLALLLVLLTARWVPEG